jgi:hypothetical protein
MTLCINNLMNNTYYLEAVKAMHQRGDYILLDNGAAEGLQCSDAYLKQMGRDVIVPNEIVLPDKIGARQPTVTAVTQYLRNHGYPAMNYMAVAQGKDLRDFKQCVHGFDSLELITAIGLPRDLLKDDRNPKSIRIDLCRWIEDTFPERFEIHFLGMHSRWPEEIRFAAKYTQARSVDTSLPFNYGLRGLRIGTVESRGIFVPRQTGYLKGDIVHSNLGIIEANIATLTRWAAGE